MSNKAMWRIVLSGLLAVICVAAVQTFWLINTFDRAYRTFDEEVTIALRNVAEQVSQLKQVQLPSNQLITKVSQDYYVVNIRDAINAAELEYYLRAEFEKLSLQTDFEYGIYDCDSDEMVYGDYIQHQNRNGIKKSGTLQPYDEYVYYFGVRFPDRKGYVLGNQWLPIAFTIVLIAAIVFFLYAIREILKQRKLSDLQKDFINNMTHEFKTPLSSIKISSDVLLDHEAMLQFPRLKTYANIIKSQSEHLGSQVERVLQIADVQNGIVSLDLEEVAIPELVDQVMHQVVQSNDKEGTSITSHVADENLVLMCDRHHLTNVIQNLLDNAIKYSGQQPVIEVATGSEPSPFVTIRDEGIGIPAEQIRKITEKFYRVPTGNIHNAKGFGLGLHYVRKICDAHGWKLEIESNLGSGTSVTLLF